MRKFYFWDIDDCDCMVEDNFNGTKAQAKKRAIKLAKKFNTTICVYDATTHDDVLIVDAEGKDVYL